MNIDELLTKRAKLKSIISGAQQVLSNTAGEVDLYNPAHTRNFRITQEGNPEAYAAIVAIFQAEYVQLQKQLAAIEVTITAVNQLLGGGNAP